jgi:hypothetical protein
MAMGGMPLFSQKFRSTESYHVANYTASTQQATRRTIPHTSQPISQLTTDQTTQPYTPPPQ